MSKKKAIILIAIVAVIVVALALITVPLNGKDSVPIGDTNYDFKWIFKSIKLGLDLEGGMYAVYEARDLANVENPTAAMNGTISNLESLLFAKGYTEATVTRQGTNEIRIEVPAVQDTEELMALIGKPAKLEFKDSSGKVLVEGDKHLKNAFASNDQGQYVISLEFNDAGREAFAKATADNVGNKLAIYIDDNKVIEPTVNGAISNGKAIITGNYTLAQAEEMATKIRSGALGLQLTMTDSNTISPTLGQNALKYGIIAGGIGILLVLAFMILIYRGLGVAASAALVVYTELLILFLAIVPWVQLTLPGIAGIVLSIGMAVDANIIIFERIKDERRLSNKSIPSAVKAGFHRAMAAIIDGNVTTIFGAIIMIIFGATAIQGFAITLLIGILLSMFSSIFVTRLFINCSLAFNDESAKYYGLNSKDKDVDGDAPTPTTTATPSDKTTANGEVQNV